MSPTRAITAGVFGAGTLTAIHETVRRIRPDAPRMAVLGTRALAKAARRLGFEPPPEGRLHDLALFGDVVSNGLFYSLVGLGGPEGALRNGALLGLAAGVGGVLLPGPLGLGGAPSARTPATKAMTVGWYVAGGVAAALAYRWLTCRADTPRR